MLWLWLIASAKATLAFGDDLSGYSGAVQSPNYPDNYPNGLKLRWSIEAKENTVIRLSFDSNFAVEPGQYGNCYDFINIIDGAYKSRLGEPCAHTVPISRTLCGESAPPDFISSSNKLIIEFCSDNTNNQAGFFIRWSALEVQTKSQICGIPDQKYPGDVFFFANGSVAGRANARIVGGSHAEPHSWPWMAALFIHGGKGWLQFCGGALVDNQWVLTAAHCFKYRGPLGIYKIKLGVDDKGQEGSVSANELTQKVCGVSSIYVHPDYSTLTTTHDVALVKLDCNVQYTAAIKPICMATSLDQWRAGEHVLIAGWGTMSYKGVDSRVLQEVIVTVVNWNKCYSDYEAGLDKSMFCAAQSGKDSCQGDSGGPLMARRNGLWILAGTISWGNGCAQPGYPGIYGDMSLFRKWIDSVIFEN